MSFGSRLVSVATTILGLTLALHAAGRPASPRASTPSGLQASTPSGLHASRASSDFVGSAACERCHEKEQKQWMNSIHIRMTKPVAQALIVGDFSPSASLEGHGRTYSFGTKNGKPFITVSSEGRPPETFQVDYTLGAKRFQGYLSTLPDGRIYVLPAFWHVESRRWIDWKEITPIPDGAHDLRQIWNTNCFNCHATNIVQGYDTEARRYDSKWTEMGIGCEACHGPGRAHVELTEAWEKDPSIKPDYDKRDTNRALSDTLKILTTRASDPRTVFDTCAYCHGNKTNVFVGFRAGDRYEDFAQPFLISEPIPANDPQGEFWPDGRASRFNRPQSLTLSGCFQSGQATCTSCHQAHGQAPHEASLKVDIHNGRDGDQLCTQCHETPKGFDELPELMASFTGPGLIQHTFHLADSEGSRCINCHMSDVNWRLLNRRRDHTMQAPVPETTARLGIPNACNTCHDDKSPEWAAKQMDQWWGDGERRAKNLTLADTMYRAGSGDVTVLPALARFAVDRSQGMLVRASAADFIARLLASGATTTGGASMQSQTSFVNGTGAAAPAAGAAASDAPLVTPAIVNALIGAASDPEPTVRVAAVKALAAAGPRERVVGIIAARLVDKVRVVRAQAVESLVELGIYQLPGAAGEALVRAQGDYLESLRTFPDVASKQAARGQFASELGRTDEAIQALDEAIRIDPSYAFPLVQKGVIAARAGRFNEAVELWKKAKTLQPGYPNIDRLIEEGEKRK